MTTETMLIPVAALVPVAVAFVAALLGFWIWMLVDCLRNESKEGKDRLIWTLVILFTKVVGAGIYYFVRYRKRRRPPLVDGAALVG